MNHFFICPPMRSKLSPDFREAVYNMYRTNKNKKLTARMNRIDPKTIRDIIKKYETFGTFKNLPIKGRPRVTDRSDDLNVLREITNSPKKTPRDIKHDLNLSCSTRTISRRIKERGLKARIAASVQYIELRNRRKRLILAKKQIRKPLSFWKRVIWSDEKKFELINSRRRVIVYRRTGERYKLKFVKPTMKYGGGSIMVWGCFGYHGMGSLHLINGIMNGAIYRDILVDELQFSADLLGIGNRFIFQQDLDSKHTSWEATDFFTENKTRVLEWSAQSPDANPIENLWSIVDASVPLSERTSIPRFWAALQRTWYGMDKNLLKKLVKSVPKRYADIIKARGGPTGN